MLFSVEHDLGSSLRFYLIPDAAGMAPCVRIRSGGNDLAVISATDVRPEILASGRHATGLCGFLIDDTLIPGLAFYSDLEVIETSSDLRIYRRKLPTYLAAKVFRLETHLLRLRNFDQFFANRFQYCYSGIDSRGSETSMQVFHIHNLESAYISGRMLLNRVQSDLNQGFRAITIFRDPFEEMAERLIVLKNVGAQAAELLGARDALTYEPVMEALYDINALDRTSCKRLFKRADREIASLLNNPLSRQLTSNSFEETLTKSCISRALQALSNFEVIGLRSDAAGYAQAVAELLDVEPTAVPVVPESSQVVELGKILRDIKDVELILEHDLELYDQTTRAFGSLMAHNR